MKFEYTFKDGVTLPLRLVLRHYDNGEDGTRIVILSVVNDDDFIETPTVVPIPQHAIMDVMELFPYIARTLEVKDSTAFDNNARGGIACRFEIEKKEEGVE